MNALEPQQRYWRIFGSYARRARGEYGLSLPRLMWMALRYYRSWKHYLTNDVSPLSARIPWIPFECQDYLRTILTPDCRVFEYGSGGSTLFFAARCAKVVSVEHDRQWYEKVSRTIRAENLTHCDCRLIPPSEGGSDVPSGAPAFVNYAGSDYPGLVFRDYARSIEDFPDETFDLVCVDGRARNSCLFHAKPKVKRGGYVLLDNAEREGYAEGKKWMQDWDKREFCGPGPSVRMFWQAVIWKRPG